MGSNIISNMKCPVCGDKTKTIDSRGCDERKKVRRRKMCLTCGHRFSTIEMPEEAYENAMSCLKIINIMKDVVEKN